MDNNTDFNDYNTPQGTAENTQGVNPPDINPSPYPYSNAGGTSFIRKKPQITGDASDRTALTVVIAMLFIMFSDMCGLFGTFNMTGWVATALYTAMLAFTGWYISRKHGKFETKALPFGIAGFLISIGYTIHGINNLSSLFPFIIFLTAEWLMALSGAARHPGGTWYHLIDLIHTFVFAPFQEFVTPYSHLPKKVKKQKGEKKKTKNVLWVILGILCGVGVLAAVIPLLIESDASFGKVFDDIFGSLGVTIKKFFENISVDWFVLIPVLFLTCVSFPIVYSSLFSFANGRAEYDNKDTSANYKKLRKAPAVFMITVLSLISVVYLVYTFVQLSYLFSAFGGKLPVGAEFSVTEYARRGFFELIEIAVINFAIIAFTVVIGRRTAGRFNLAVKILDIFLCLFTMLITAISASKILLYINTFGLTENRIWAMAADIILFFGFLAILLRLLIARFPYMKVIIAVASVVFIAISLIGPARLTATTNYNLYKEGKLASVDVDTLDLCGAAGFDYLVKLLDDPVMKKDAEEVLQWAGWDYTEIIFDKDGNYNNILSISSVDEFRASKTAQPILDYLRKLSEQPGHEIL